MKKLSLVRRVFGFLRDRTQLGIGLLWHPEMKWPVRIAAVCFFAAVVLGGYALYLGNPGSCVTFIKDEGCLKWDWTRLLWPGLIDETSLFLFILAGILAVGVVAVMAMPRGEDQ